MEGAAVSFRMPEEGPGGTFARNMRTEIASTTPDGRATVYDMQWNRLTGPFQIRITATKGEIRAGVLAAQYISDTVKAPASNPLVSAKHGGSKWMLIAAVVGGAAAAGLAVGMKGSGSRAPSVTSGPPPQIGTPTLTIGRP
ncbi:MAG: hypothetical protein WKF37_21730 [Bryobacteraceae bacterium]